MARKSEDRKSNSEGTTPATGLSRPVSGRRSARFAADMGDAGDMQEAKDMKDARDIPKARDMGDAQDMGVARDMAAAPAFAALAVARRPVNGNDVLEIGRRHIGEKYVFGARVPIANAGWTGPWDCAEFVSWCVYQSAGILFGTQPSNDPLRADAYTGYWEQQADKQGCTVAVADAVAIPGAILLRRPQPGATGHIVFCDGRGGTVEAHSSARGVIAGSVTGRRWDGGILVPGINYFRSDQEVPTPDSPFVLRLTHPIMQGNKVLQVQVALNKLGLPAGAEDGIYGPQTAHAVEIFQAQSGLVADGEVGPTTEAKLFAIP